MLNLMSFSPSNFGRYVSQTEQSLSETNGINEWSTKTPPASNINGTATFLPVVSTSSPSPSAPAPISVLPVNNTQKITLPATIMKDEYAEKPFPQHGPGPIQRPNKLANQPTTAPTYLSNPIQSPGTPEVLYQINRFLDQQSNPTTTSASTSSSVTGPTATTSKITTNMANSSVPIADLSTPNIPWTPFAQTEWSSKYDSSWPMTTPVENPFTLITSMNGQQRAPTNEDTTVWPTSLGTATPRLVTNTRTERAAAWNDIFQSTVPSSSTELAKPTANSWLWTVPDPSTTDTVGRSNGHETNTNHAIWSLNTLSNEHVIPSTIPTTQQVPPTGWWLNSTSDENNNTNQTNRLNDDASMNRDQSRWDFAR